MNYLHVRRELVPAFTRLFGHGAVRGTSDNGSYFLVIDKEIREKLEKYLFGDALTMPLSISRLSDTWSPRELLEHVGFDRQRLDALKMP
jgi:hypothetical protein